MTPDEAVKAAEARAYGLRRAYLFGDGSRTEWRDAADVARALRNERDAARPVLTVVAGGAA